MTEIVSNAVSNGTANMKDTLNNIKSEATNAGIEAGNSSIDLSGLDGITADSGIVKIPDIITSVNVNIDINSIIASNSGYQALTDEEKAIVDSVLASIKNEAETQATVNAN